MLQTHHQLKLVCEEYNSLFSKNEFYPLQKAYTTPHFLVLGVRFPGRSVAIYIGRGNQYQGFFLADKLPPSYLRVQDRFLDYLRKYLVGARIGKIEIDEGNMVIQFRYKNEHAENLFFFGYKERQLFFARQSKEDIYLSWSGEAIHGNNLLKRVNDFGPDRGPTSESQKTWQISDYLQDEEKKIGGQPIQKKREKFLLKKMKNISEDLESAKKWSLLQGDLNENRLDLSGDELKVHGQKIKLLGATSPWQKRDLIFKKIKKLKKGEIILTSRLEESSDEFENTKRGEFEYEVTKEKVIQPLWITHQKQNKAQDKNFNIKTFKIKNLIGSLGLDAASNDEMRSRAHKEHYWFHIENYTGSHCIIKTDDFTQLSMADLAAIGSMLRDFSKIELQEIPIVYTQVKNLKGVKGAKGMVTIKKQKHLRCLYMDWTEIISIL